MWYWNVKSARYHWRNGRELFVARAAVLDMVDRSMDASGLATDQLARMVSEGLLSPGDWRDLMRREVKDEYIRQYLLGRGGLAQMGPEDWGSIGGMLKEQYGWLNGFYDLVAAGDLSEAQIAARARMYSRSAREAYERANRRAHGLPELPAYPGDGATQCLCITTPESRVLTKRGWVAFWDIQIGDQALTHEGRWRAIVGFVVKPSQLGCREMIVETPTGKRLGCTADHLWWTPAGWLSAEAIAADGRPVYQRLRVAEEFAAAPLRVAQSRLLPVGTAIYDITVEEDASFVVEGLVSHNTNCACHWEIDEVWEDGELTGWDCTWTLGPVKTEHCDDCLDNAAKWAPLFVPAEKGEA